VARVNSVFVKWVPLKAGCREEGGFMSRLFINIETRPLVKVGQAQ